MTEIKHLAPVKYWSYYDELLIPLEISGAVTVNDSYNYDVIITHHSGNYNILARRGNIYKVLLSSKNWGVITTYLETEIYAPASNWEWV